MVTFIICLGVWLVRIIPTTSFVPSEDQGFLISALMLPDNATLKRTENSGEQFRQMVAKNPAIQHLFVIGGFDLIRRRK